jgi:uncharacterized protein (TIGR00297 family)
MPFLTPIPPKDWLFGIGFLAGLIGLILSVEWIYRLAPRRGEAMRQFVHIATGVMVLLTPFIFTSWVPIFVLAALFTLVNYWSIRRGKLNSIHGIARASFGTVYYPVSLMLLLVLFWDRHVMILIIAFSLMAFADAVAAIAGHNAPARERLPLPWDKKSIRGSMAMFFCSTVLVAAGLILLGYGRHFSVSSMIGIATAIGLLATAAEVISYRGSDNLSVPLLAALGLYITTRPDLQQQFFLGEGMAFGVALVAFVFGALDLSGAIAAFLLGTAIFGVGGWRFSIPILLFFITSSFLSQLPRRWANTATDMIAKGARRDAAQVLANGLLPAIVVIGSLGINQTTAFLLYLGGVAAATADTWATEIGLASSGKPRSIITGKIVAPGTSGGITLAGIVGAILGASLIATAGWWSHKWFTREVIRWDHFVGIILAGVVAHFIDSLLGATLQRKNSCPVCAKLTERNQHCGQQTLYASGISWMDNDVVNLICGLSGILLTAVSSATL